MPAGNISYTSVIPGKRRRSNFDIIYEILKLSEGCQTRKPEIINKLNMRHDQVDKYLEYMQGKSLLEKVCGERGLNNYTTTNKGEKTIEILSEIRKMLGYKLNKS